MSFHVSLISIEPKQRFDVGWYGSSPDEQLKDGEPDVDYCLAIRLPGELPVLTMHFATLEQLGDVYAKIGQLLQEAEMELMRRTAFAGPTAIAQHSE